MRKNIVFAIIIALIMVVGTLTYQWWQVEEKLERQTKKNKDLTEQIQELKKEIEELKDSEEPDGNGNENGSNEEPELETYRSELFIQASWGAGKGEVGLHNPSAQGIVDGGPNYGPQSFDIDDKTGHLFLLDSVNERVIEYDEKGKYQKDFPIACGGTGDIRVSPDSKYLYVFSWRCGAVYKYDIGGKLLETYSMSKEILLSTLGTEGLEFDKEGNIMLELEIEDYANGDRFYQIGKKGDEWKNNNFIGYISKDGKEFYHIKTIDKKTVSVRVLDEKGSFKRGFSIILPEEAYIYYRGCDRKENLYFNVGFKEVLVDKNNRSDEFIWKYNQEGNLLARIDLFSPLRKFFKDDELLSIPRVYLYANDFISIRTINKGDIYWMTSFMDKGIKIFKYSIGKTSTQIGYIKKVYEKNGKRYLDIDYVQWLTGEEALKAGIEDGICDKSEKIAAQCFPNNFYIRNQNPKIRTFEISKNVEIIMCSYGDFVEWDKHIDYKAFKNLFDKNVSPDSHFTDYLTPFHVTIQNDKIIKITEQYTS